jgi:formamidopyrimidine-DNA glycosylase
VPEVLEVEAYRRVAERASGRRVDAVEASDRWYLKGGLGPGVLREALVGAVLTGARRRGKLLLIDTDRGVVLGLRFGMTGRLLLFDGGGPPCDEVGPLLHAPAGDRPRWHRFGLRLTDGSHLVVTDPRRLGGVSLDPPLDRIGPEATEVTPQQLSGLLRGDRALKAILMDQRCVAGLGNLLTDEVLWRAELDPRRPAGTLDPAEAERLADVVRATLAELAARGGSHTGDLQQARRRGGRCPRCGSPLERAQLGGRTTYWCPSEQS